MSNYNVHLTPEVYEELMAKRRAERDMEARRKVGKVRSITDPVPESEIRKIVKGSRCILTSIPFDVRPYLPHSPRKPPIAGRHGDMNKTEAKFLADVLHGEGRFEPVTLKLEGGSRYTPDFMTREGDVTVFYEVKGSFRLGSEGRAHTAFYEAASQFPWCRFVWAVLRKGGKWDLKTLDHVS